MLTLKEAVETGQLEAFIAEREKDGIEPASEQTVEEALRHVITSPQGSRPASRSPDRDGSPEK